MFIKDKIVAPVTFIVLMKPTLKDSLGHEQDRVNWPDYQWRIWKNKSEIKWVNKVHEVLTGFETFSPLPQNPELALQHSKTIENIIKYSKTI